MSSTSNPLRAVEKLADEVHDLGRRLTASERRTDAGRTAIDSGAMEVTDEAGQVIMTIGADGGAAAITYTAGPTPGIPTTPTLTPVVGGLAVTWDGRLLDEANTPSTAAPAADFQHVAVYVSQDVDPDVEDPFDASELVPVAVLPVAGTATVGLTAGRYEVRLVAVSRAGLTSEPSEFAEADVERLSDDPDLASALGDLDTRLEGATTDLALADERLADLASRFTFSEVEPTQADAEGRSEDSVWTQIFQAPGEATATEVGRWQLVDGQWVSIGLEPTVIPNLLSWLAVFQHVDVSKLVATDASIGEAVILKLWTDMFKARKISAQELLLSSVDNLLEEPTFAQSGAGWDYADIAAVLPTGGEASTPALQVTGTGSIVNVYERIGHDARPTTAGQGYRVSARVYSATDLAPGVVRIVATFARPGGGTTGRTYAVLTNSAAIPANTWSSVEGVLVSTATSAAARVRFGFGLTAAATSATTVAFSEVSIFKMTSGQLVVDGAIDGQIITGPTIQTNKETDKGLKLSNAGLVAFPPDGGDPVVQIRPDGGTAVGISDAATGDLLAGFDQDGGVSGQVLSIAQSARIDGVIVAGGDPLTDGHLGPDSDGSWGPVFNGRSLLGGTFMGYVDEHPTVVDGNSWLTAAPHGPKVNAWRERTTVDTWDGQGGQDHTRMMLTCTLNAVGNRAYLLTYQAPAIRETGTVGSGTLGAALVRRSVAGGSVGATTGTPLPGTRVYLPRGGAYTMPTSTTLLRCPEDIPEGKIMLGVEVYVYAGRTAESSASTGANQWSVSVLDVGLRVSGNQGVMVDLQKQGTATPTTPPAPEPDPVRQYTKTYSPTWHQSYLGSGAQASARYDGQVAQGYTPYYTPNGVMRGMVGFPSMAADLNGATIKKIEVYVYAAHWYANSGGTLCIGTHGKGSKPGTWSSVSNDVKRQGLKKPEGRWVTLPASVHAGFKAGTLRGITTYPPGGSTSSAYYGYLAGAKTKMRVTYTK